jgi:hypothetical protein
VRQPCLGHFSLAAIMSKEGGVLSVPVRRVRSSDSTNRHSRSKADGVGIEMGKEPTRFLHFFLCFFLQCWIAKQHGQQKVLTVFSSVAQERD